MSVIIEAEQLTKKYGDTHAVNGLSFEVLQGQVFAFLGQNGAGKSTTIRMLLSLVRPDKGTIRVFGKDLRKERISILRRTGAVIEKPDLYGYLNGRQNLSLFARLNGIRLSEKQLQGNLELVGLADRGGDKVKTYSQGMKQRLGIAVAMVHDPDLVILDEPTNGLDPQGIVDIRNLILHLCHDRGKTVFISSHLLSEVEKLADQILIIEKGKKVMQGSVSELVTPENVLLEVDSTDNEACRQWLISTGRIPEAGSVKNDRIRIKMPVKEISRFSVELVQNGFGIISFTQVNSLENYFLSLVQ